jgi:hypothetical protein
VLRQLVALSARWFLVPKLAESPTIGEHDPVDRPDELAALDRSYRDGDLIVWLKLELTPAKANVVAGD